MGKQVDWAALEAKAAVMTAVELHYARLDAAKTAAIWDRAPDLDYSGNAGYYRDEASVYAREQARRAAC